MAKYKTTDVSAGQGLFLSVNLNEQLLPGSFEFMLNKLIGTKIDISIFDKNYQNDETGASAVPPSVLLKLIIYGYHNGCKSSRKIWALSRENIIAKALTGDMEIHWTTIADFISKNSQDFTEVFVKVLGYCNELELLGGGDYAVDGLRLPSNASKDMSGTKEELWKRVEVYRKMAEKHLAKHLKADTEGEVDEDRKKHFEIRQRELSRRIENLSNFFDMMHEKPGKHIAEVKSNVTDNESAMIHSSKGFIQGYIGIAVADKKNQVLVAAEAVGTANEGGHLPGLIDQTFENLGKASVKLPLDKKPVFMADTNYFSEENFQACRERNVEAIIPGGEMKRSKGADDQVRYVLDDFIYNEAEDSYECPYRKKLGYKGVTILKSGERKIYQASLTDCKACPGFSRRIWTKKKSRETDHGKKILVSENGTNGRLCRAMRKKLETEEYKEKYSRRIQIIEPVFANIGYCKGLNRFMLRGKRKVNSQWLLYCIVHNLSKCLIAFNVGKKAVS
jgi:transposase